MNYITDLCIWSLNDIWNKVKKPFIAESNTGWLVMITSDPKIQQDKYNGNTYGRIDKNYDRLFLKTRSQIINGANLLNWKLVKVLNEDNH